MTVRPRIVPDFAVPIVPRPSARVSRVAEILDCDERDVRRMIDTGDLEAHGKGKRGVRVFLDSVATYQEHKAIRPKVRRSAPPRPSNRPTQASTAAHLAAMEDLRKAGIVP